MDVQFNFILRRANLPEPSICIQEEEGGREEEKENEGVGLREKKGEGRRFNIALTIDSKQTSRRFCPGTVEPCVQHVLVCATIFFG